MKNITIILIAFFSVIQLFSQEVCISKNEKHIDINVLDVNKCTVKDEGSNNERKNNKKNIIVSNTRYLKKRTPFNQVTRVSSHLKGKSTLKVKPDNKLDARLLLVLKNQSKANEVSFDLVEEIPLFASCIDSSFDKTDCFNYEMEKHINNNFIYPKKALQKGIEGDLEVTFTIGVDGEVKDVMVKGFKVHEVLEKEAKRIVSLLPRFISGKQNGVKIEVSYSFPMSFTLD